MRTSNLYFVAADVRPPGRNRARTFPSKSGGLSTAFARPTRELSLHGSVARRYLHLFLFKIVLLFGLNAAAAESTNTVAVSGSLGDVGASLARVMLALALVLGIFLGGVWLFRNWQRLTIHRGQAPKLNVIEARSLGGRHALYVVGYEQERFLVAASPTGINLLTHLQPADPGETPDAAPAPASFARALAQKLRGK